MKKPPKIIFEKYLYNLSVDELTEYLKEYDRRNKTKVLESIQALKMNDLQQRLEALNIVNYCPHCLSEDTKKNGKHNNIQRYLCKNCNKTFSLFTGTFLEDTNWSWEVWIKLVQMTINTTSLDKMVDILEKDYQLEGINRKTVFLARHKLLCAMSAMPLPKLSGVVQIDETGFRENQKGTRTDTIDMTTGKKRELINVLPKKIPKRLPRYGRMPSRLGFLGPEYACAVCAVDNKGHAVSYITNLGKMTIERFTDCFDKHFENITYLCTDANPTYNDYAQLKHIPHYIRPSSYVKTLIDYGYIINWRKYDTDSTTIPNEVADEIENLYVTKRDIMKKLYDSGLIDYIEFTESMPFNEFCKLKKQYGLNLSRVNSFHNYLKLNIDKIMTGVATKYLPDYVGAYTFIYNWKTDYGTTLASLKDAESVLIQLLQTKSAYTLKAIVSKSFFIAPQPTGRYLAIIDEETRKARRVLDNKFFKFDEEDRVVSFDKLKYLKNTNETKLRAKAKKYKVRGYSTMSHWKLYCALKELPNVNEIVYELIQDDKVYSIYSEDVKYMKDNCLSESDITYSRGGDIVDLDRLHILDKTGLYTDFDEDEE